MSSPSALPSLEAPFVSVTPILSGDLDLPRGVSIAGVSDSEKDIPDRVTCLLYLVAHPLYGKILFDLGLTKDIAKPNYGRYAPYARLVDNCRNVFHPKLADHNRSGLAECLRTQHNCEVSEITHVILSHFHWDHSGDIADFPKSKVVMGKGVTDVRYHVCCTHADHSDYVGPELLPIQRSIHYFGYDSDSAQTSSSNSVGIGIGPFERSYDLYGDGTVFIVDGPGHVAGHIMLVCKSVNGYYLLAGDGIYTSASYSGPKPIAKGVFGGQSVDADPDIAFETIRKIHAFHQMGGKVAQAHFTLNEWKRVKPILFPPPQSQSHRRNQIQSKL